MKKRQRRVSQIIAVVIIVLIIFFLFFQLYKTTGKAVSDENTKNSETHTIGPSQEEQNCLKTCMNCVSIGVNCTGDRAQCEAQCNAKKPEITEETSCMEACVVKGCDEYDFSCQTKNQASCEKECNMIKEPEAKNAEEQCIRDCVNLHAKGTICKPSQEGEQGNDVCQMCAKQCVHLYAGPCLDEEKLEAAKKECETCEHCYGEPIMGDSGEGWECIINVECKDASSEFGDNPGTGPGIIAKAGEAMSNIGEAIVDFFQNIFTGNSEENNENSNNNAIDNSNQQESQPEN